MENVNFKLFLTFRHDRNPSRKALPRVISAGIDFLVPISKSNFFKRNFKYSRGIQMLMHSEQVENAEESSHVPLSGSINECVVCIAWKPIREYGLVQTQKCVYGE